MMGPGKYDDVCTTARERAGGSVVLIVVGGSRGSGFSAQCDEATLRSLPRLLESMAQQIREDARQAFSQGRR